MQLTLVGPGRLGRSLAFLLRDAEVDLRLLGRGDPVEPSDVYWLTVPDRAIATVASSLPRGAIVLHASGATGLGVLEPHVRRGSLHPLMTFPGPEVGIPDLAGVPAAVDGHPDAVAAASQLCRLLGLRPLPVPGDRRLYHCAAVMAGNFATVLLAEAARVLEAAGVPQEQCAEVLTPLALASLRGASADPVGALTGPAVRGDQEVVDGHLRALDEAGLTRERQLYEQIAAETLRLLASRASRR